MSTLERKEHEKTRLKQKIIKTALKLIKSDGVKSLTVRKIAERIDYSPTTIYLYFKNKDELMFNVIEWGFEKLSLALGKAYAKYENADIDTILLECLRAYVQFGFDDIELYRLMFATPQNGKYIKKYRTYALKEGTKNAEAFGLLVQLVEVGRVHGRLKVEDDIFSARYLWAGIHGVTMLLCDQSTAFIDAEREAFVTEYLTILIKGIENN